MGFSWQRNRDGQSLVALLILLLSLSASAAPYSPDDVEAGSDARTLKDKVELSYWGVYHGASLNDPGNSRQPGFDGSPNEASSQGLENWLTTGYKFDPSWMVGVIGHFYYNVVESSMATPTDTQGVPAGFTSLNPALTISKIDLIDDGPMKARGYFSFFLPLSRYDYISAPGRNMIGTAEPTLVLSYAVPKTRLTLGLFTYIDLYIPSAATPDGSLTYKLYAAPTLTYQFTPTLAGTVWMDAIQATRSHGTGFISGLSNPESDIIPGLSWSAVPGIIVVNPGIMIFPGHPTLASTSLSMYLFGYFF